MKNKKIKIKIGSKIKVFDDSGYWLIENIFEVLLVNEKPKLHLIEGDLLLDGVLIGTKIYVDLSYLIGKDFIVLS